MLPTVVDGAAAVLVINPVQERLIDAFLAGRSPQTIRAYRRDLQAFAAFRGAADGAADIDTAARAFLLLTQGEANGAALGWRADMIAARLSPATINRRIAALRSLVKVAGMLGLATWTLTVENVRSSSYRDTRGPGRDGVRAIVEQARRRNDAKGLRDVAIVRLLHDMALRRGEVVSLDLEHYDPRRGQLEILGKGRSERESVTVPAQARAALDTWIAARGRAAGPLFGSLDRARRGDGRLTGAAVYAIVRALGAGAGLVARPHGLRHSAITAVLDRTNGNIRSAQKFARHRDVRTTQLYDDNRTDLAGQMAALISED